MNQHFIQQETEQGQGRYRLHPMIADYARRHFALNDAEGNPRTLQEAHEQAAHYYLQVAESQCPEIDRRHGLGDVAPLVEAVWQFVQAERLEEAYNLMKQEKLFDGLKLWGANTVLLELCQILLMSDWRFTPQQRALIHSYMAATLVAVGEKQQALSSYEEILAICSEVGDRDGEAVTLNNLGMAYYHWRERRQALWYYQQALAMSRDVGNRSLEGSILNNLGLLYNDLENKQQAVSCYEEALTIFREMDNRQGEGSGLNNLGILYSEMGNKQQALNCYEQSLTIRRQLGDRMGEGATLNNLGGIYIDLRDNQQALRCYRQSLDIYRDVGNRIREGDTLGKMGTIYFESRQYEAAFACFTLASTLFKQVQHPDVQVMQEWIQGLRKTVGDKRFKALLTQVESRAEQIVNDALAAIDKA